jgi:hypothetical protein
MQQKADIARGKKIFVVLSRFFTHVSGILDVKMRQKSHILPKRALFSFEN